MFDLILQSILLSSFILYFDFTTQIGNINDWYRIKLINFFGDDNLIFEDKESQINSKFYKVLIGCIYCYQFWITLFFVLYTTFFVENLIFNEKNVIFAIIETFKISSLNYIFMRLYNKNEEKEYEIKDKQAKILLTNPKIWEKVETKDLPKVAKPKKK